MKRIGIILLCVMAGAVASARTPRDTADARGLEWSLGTNLLYDALAVPNINAEFYACGGFSFAGSWMQAWWSNDSRHRYWRFYGGRVAARYWLGANCGRGHHFGVFGMMYIYDFELGGKGYMSGVPGQNIFSNPSYAVGVEYGYALRLSPSLMLDFSIDLGYAGGKYIEYRPEGEHYAYERTCRRRWFGPTGAAITINWTFPRKI